MNKSREVSMKEFREEFLKGSRKETRETRNKSLKESRERNLRILLEFLMKSEKLSEKELGSNPRRNQ